MSGEDTSNLYFFCTANTSGDVYYLGRGPKKYLKKDQQVNHLNPANIFIII